MENGSGGEEGREGLFHPRVSMVDQRVVVVGHRGGTGYQLVEEGQGGIGLMMEGGMGEEVRGVGIKYGSPLLLE